MTRKTMLIQSVVVKKVPTAATAVSVTIAPLWQALTVGGTFSGVSGSQTIALTKQSDGRTWILAGESGEHVLSPRHFRYYGFNIILSTSRLYS